MAMSVKISSLLLILILVVLSLIIVESVFAQSIAKPSIPEFTATLISSPSESQSINRTIELAIKNQPIISFYNVRMRVNDGDWIPLYPNNSVPIQSTDEFTVLSYRSGHLGVESQYHFGYRAENLSASDKVDFQVQAMVGSIHRVFNPNATNQLEMYPYVFSGETSDWSNTQTITMPEEANSDSETTSTPTNMDTTKAHSYVDFSLIIALIVIAVLVASITSLLLHVRRNKKSITKN